MIDAKLLTHGGQKKFTYWPACAVFTVFGASIRLTVNHPRALWKITWCALPNSLWIANTQLGYIFIYNLMSSSATPEILLGRKFEHSGLHIAHSRHLIMLRPKWFCVEEKAAKYQDLWLLRILAEMHCCALLWGGWADYKKAGRGALCLCPLLRTPTLGNSLYSYSP